jgi:acetyltransferase-like isoleucine patch superfamily enzyme
VSPHPPLRRLWERSTLRGFGLMIHYLRRRARFHPRARLRGSAESLALGSKARISERCNIGIDGPGRVCLGAGVWVAADCELETEGRIEVGDGTTIQRRSSMIGTVTVGSGCIIAPNVFMSSGTHLFERWPHLPIREQERRAETSDEPIEDLPITIGDDCWIGANVVVAPGASVGRGCVIGANSVVVGDVPPYAIVVGAPGRVVRRRMAWDPPTELDATDARAVPYLLRGFRIRFGRLADDAIVAEVSGEATMALRRPPAGQLLLVAMRADRALMMRIGAGPPMQIEPGRNDVLAEVPSGDGPGFELSLIPETKSLALGAVQLLGVRVAPSGVGAVGTTSATRT